MNFAVEFYANLLRGALFLAIIFHLIKRSYKPVIPAVSAFFLTYLLAALEYFFAYRIDALGGILYLTIIVMALYLGSALKFYDKLRWWDWVIHFLSGILFVSVGIALAATVAGLSLISVLIFSFTLSVTLHVVWELLEYGADCLLRTDNQRWQKRSPARNHQPKLAAQPAGLVDTMNDTLICILGASTACAAWFFVL